MDVPPHGRRVGGKIRKGPRPDRPKTYDTLQRRTALPSKKIFLPRYLGKNIFSSYKTATRQIAKNPKTQTLKPKP